MEQGPIEKTIIEQCVRHNQPLPSKLANAPEVSLGLELYYLAFCDLSSCREQGYVEGPVSWLTINAYAIAKNFEGEQREDLFYLIQRLDAAYMTFRAKPKPDAGKKIIVAE